LAGKPAFDRSPESVEHCCPLGHVGACAAGLHICTAPLLHAISHRDVVCVVAHDVSAPRLATQQTGSIASQSALLAQLIAVAHPHASTWEQAGVMPRQQTGNVPEHALEPHGMPEPKEIAASPASADDASELPPLSAEAPSGLPPFASSEGPPESREEPPASAPGGLAVKLLPPHAATIQSAAANG
jgi:hypothetical protein